MGDFNMKKEDFTLDTKTKENIDKKVKELKDRERFFTSSREESDLKRKKEYRGETQTMSSIGKKIFTKEKKTKKSNVIATIVAWSVISVATVGLVVGLSGQAKVDRNVDQLSKTNPDQLNKLDETLNSISRRIAGEKKANKEKYDLEQKAKAEEAKRKQDEAEQARKKQAEQPAAPQQAPVGYTVSGYSSASSDAIQGIIDSNLTAWVSISDIPTAGGVAVFGHTDFTGRPSAGAWVAGASVGEIVTVSGTQYRITNKYIVNYLSDEQYDAVYGTQPGELVFITCATYDQGTDWVLRTQRI